MSAPPEGSTGLVLIQVDGLGYRQVLKALEEGAMPHLKRMIQRGHICRPTYSGIPSTTPAVQAELFYGLKCVVPAFEFYDRESNFRRVMRNPRDAHWCARGFPGDLQGLLTGGSAYCSVFSGGASEPHMVPEAIPEIWSSMRRFYRFNLRSIAGLIRLLWRLCLLLPVELVQSMAGFMEGMRLKEPFQKEFAIIGARLGVKVLIREIIHEGIIDDLKEGLPIIQANFLAYDECAHRRGPDSFYAHKSLRSIDNVIASVDRFILKRTPPYRLVIYSDHGQERVVPYRLAAGEPFERQVRRIWKQFMRDHGIQSSDEGENPVVCDMGPLAHVYIRTMLSTGHLEELAQRFAEMCSATGFLFLGSDDSVYFADGSSIVTLGESVEKILGEGHPYPEQAYADLDALVRHRHSGDLVGLGWSATGNAISFAEENGAHGGPGRNETESFVVCPPDLDPGKGVLRPSDLYATWLSGRKMEANQ